MLMLMNKFKNLLQLKLRPATQLNLKNLDLTNKKSGSGGKNREITHPKSQLFVVSFFYS